MYVHKRSASALPSCDRVPQRLGVLVGSERTDPDVPSLERPAPGRTSGFGVHGFADRELLVHGRSLARRV